MIQRGLLAPPLVCGSMALLDTDAHTAQQYAARLDREGRNAEAAVIRREWAGRPVIAGELLTKQDVLDLFLELIRDPTKILVGANIAFDLLVLALAWAQLGVDVLPDIFQAFQDQRIFDLQIAEALHAVANGHLGKDPRTGKPLVNRETGKRGMYSLDNCVELVLGRVDAKANNIYRTRYAEFEFVPQSQWPFEARQYPVDDAVGTMETALGQTGHLPKVTPQHDWGESGCTVCGATRFGELCISRRRHRNLHDHAAQVFTAFCLHLGAAWGFHVDQSKVDLVEAYALRKRAGGIQPFIDAGIIRPEGSVNERVLKTFVARAYGATKTCPQCQGTGRMKSANPRQLQCKACRGRSATWKCSGKFRAPTVVECGECGNTGKVDDPKHLVGCAGPDGEITCDGTGLRLTSVVPRSETGRIGKGADALHESGEEFVMSYGDFTEDAKWLKDYVPYLRQGRRQLATGGWFDIALTLSPNPILETGRVSYRGYIQLFPRWPGFTDKKTDQYIPSFRECVVARKGYKFSSEDFRAGELVTLAETTRVLVGFSDLGDVLLSKDKNGKPMDVHSMLATQIIGVPYEELIAGLKTNWRFKDTRQACKPPNFGFPGGMGIITFILQARRQGEDTPHPTGHSLVDDGNGKGNMVSGYKGMRFCILMGGEGPCGGPGNMTYVWNDMPCPPVCSECAARAVELKEAWSGTWREMKPYFKYASNCVENGQLITADMLRRWPHLQETFSPRQRLAPGEIMQLVSGRIRGGVEFCAAANGWFQGLLSDITKHAYRMASYECYVRGYRVPDMLFDNSIRSAYAGGDSPLWGSRIPGFFHDELFGEHPESVASDAAWRISEIMRDTMRWYCPDYADAAEAEPTLMECWDKRASKVVHNDRLVPWTKEHDPKKCGECAAQTKRDELRKVV
jgi:hypothetical protein